MKKDFCPGNLTLELSKILEELLISKPIEGYYKSMIDKYDSNQSCVIPNLFLTDLKGIDDILNKKESIRNIGIDLPIYFGEYNNCSSKIMIVAMDPKRNGQDHKEIVMGSVFGLHDKKGRETSRNDYWKFVAPLLDSNFIYLTDVYKLYYEYTVLKNNKSATIISNKDPEYLHKNGTAFKLNKTILEREIASIKPDIIVSLGLESANALKMLQGIKDKENYMTHNGIEYIFMPHIARTVTQSIPTIANLFIAMGKIKKHKSLIEAGEQIHLLRNELFK